MKKFLFYAGNILIIISLLLLTLSYQGLKRCEALAHNIEILVEKNNNIG